MGKCGLISLGRVTGGFDNYALGHSYDVGAERGAI